MDIEEASMVIPIYQLIPIFGYFLSYFILNEKLNTSQIFACLLILAGILLLTLEFDVNRKIKFKTKVLFLVATSSFLFALHDTLFKMVAITESFWITVFWQYFSIAVFGLLLLIFVKKFRMSLVQMLSFTRKKILSLNVLSEGLYILGNLASNFATLLAPVALVLVIGSLQPLFVFIIGTLLSIFIPSLSHEKLSKQHMLQKIASIVLILAGSWFLFAN